MGLVFSTFINKTYQANNWSAKKIPSVGNLALMHYVRKMILWTSTKEVSDYKFVIEQGQVM